MLKLVVAAALFVAGCGGAAIAGAPDAPVPASEARQTLVFEVGLEPGSDCEQRFDLALYANRGIDLVTWDDHDESCRQRKVSVRFLAKRIDERAVRDLVRKNANSVREMK